MDTEQRRRELEQLSREDLIEGYLLLEKRVETLEKRLDDILSTLNAPPKTSKNTSVPPSQSPKTSKSETKTKAKRGPKKGHPGTSRKRETPDDVYEYRVETCACCGESLGDHVQHEVGRHQVIDIPPVQYRVGEIVRYGLRCPSCETYQRAEAPPGYEFGRVFGPRLEGLVMYLHYAHPLSYQRVQQIVEDVCGLDLGIGTLVNIVKRASEAAQTGAEAVLEQIQAAQVVGSDETGARIDDENHWLWVFQNDDWVYTEIRPSRAAAVIEDVVGDEADAEVWVSDAYPAQLINPAEDYQLCLAHQLRDLQYAIDAHDCEWAKRGQELFRRAIQLHHERPADNKRNFQARVETVIYHVDQWLQRVPDNDDSLNLRKRFHKHRAALLLFLHRDDVPPTNNASERALRNSVIYRKVTGGFRTEWGARTYANVISLLQTARRQGQSLMDTMIDLVSPDQEAPFTSPGE